LATSLGQEECRLAGGLAVAAHGFVRATKGIDLVTRLPLEEARRRLREHAIPATLFRGDVLEGDFPCLRGALERVPFDILPELVAIDWEEGPVVLESRRTRLRVVSLANLLALKMKAQGPKDLSDAAMLVLLHPEVRATALAFAAAYRAADRFAVWLEDPRLERDAQQQPAARITTRLSPRGRHK
jgi:hypothetical protein